MISLELAKKLKVAGLVWEPNFGDLYQLTIDGLNNTYCFDEGIQACVDAKNFNPIWLPRLDQLLAEIERRGFEWQMNSCLGKGYIMVVWDYDDPENDEKIESFISRDTPEETTGEALLWILGQANE